MKVKSNLLLCIAGLFIFIQTGFSQVAWFIPDNPPRNKMATLVFNAKAGNGALAGYQCDVYFHTGVITNKSIDGGDWKHVVGNWGEADSRVKMTSLGDDLYQVKFVINDFYGLQPDEIPQQLAFVFRSENGSRVGKTKTNEDIFIPVNGYVPPVKEAPKYAFEKREYVSHSFFEHVLKVLTNHGLITIEPFNSTTIKVQHFPNSVGASSPSDAVILAPQPVHSVASDDDAWVKLMTDSLTVLVHKNPVYVAFVYHYDTILQEEKGYFRRDDTDGLRFKMADHERFFGLGERANALNLRGSSYNLYNRPKYGYEIGAKNLNYSIPLVVSTNHYLMLFDNPQKGYVDLGENDPGIMEWGVIGGPMQYYLVVGSDFKTISHEYATLTGFQPLPPFWALGNLQSRMGYKSQVETDSIVHLMQKEDFPIDAVILDFYWFGDSIMGTLGRLNWYKPNWPDPKQMIDGFKLWGIKTILITEPYIIDTLKNFKITSELGLLARDSTGNTYVNDQFYFGSAGLIDIFNPQAADWFWKQYKPQIEMGVAGWWGDLGEPENHPADQYHVFGKADEVHNIYGHYWHKKLFEQYRKDYPDTRLFNLNRAGYAGSQRYSIFPWTGDVSRSWGGLQAQLPLMIHMSLSGLPFIHSDAGGFAQGTRDEELYTRWLQMACFSPILRPHGSGIPSEPVYFNDTTRQVVRDFMHLRYSLLPYIYTLTFESHTLGYPIVRPLFYEFPGDTNAYNIEDEYMFGPDFLIAPILKPDLKTRQVYLPKGDFWYDFWSNLRVTGGQNIDVPVDIQTIPIFVRAGSFITKASPVNTTNDICTQYLKVDYYLNSYANMDSGFVYLDDGALFDAYEKGEYHLMKFRANQQENGDLLEFAINSEGNGYYNEPPEYHLTLKVIGGEKEYQSITLEQKLEDGTIEMVEVPKDQIEITDEGPMISFTWGSDPVTIRLKK
jgi:oligosaccharide 4-alpha-D-glucosyltransferase